MNNVGLEVFSSEFDKMTAAQVGKKSQVSLDQIMRG
jgi:hypothetical protein